MNNEEYIKKNCSNCKLNYPGICPLLDFRRRNMKFLREIKSVWLKDCPRKESKE